MRRILMVLLDLFAVILFAAAFIIKYFTDRKLGMNRWVVFKQMQIKKVFDLSWGKYILLAIILILMILVVRGFITKKGKGIGSKLLMILMAGEILYGLYFTLFVNLKAVRCYDLMLLCFYASAFLLIFGNMLLVSGHDR